MHFLGLLNTEIHYFASTQTQRTLPPHNTGYEPVRNATVAWTTRITSHCQCSNAEHVMVWNCSDTDTYWAAPPISWLLRNNALWRWNSNNVSAIKRNWRSITLSVSLNKRHETFRQSVFSFLQQTGQFHAVQYHVRVIPFCYEPPVDRILILGNSICVCFSPT